MSSPGYGGDDRGPPRQPSVGESVLVLRPAAPSRRFTWGVRAGLMLATLVFAGLVVWNRHDADRGLTPLGAVLLGLAALVALVGLVQAWCWAGRPRFTATQSDAITAGLSRETKRTVRRMAHGRGPDVPELRSRAAAYALLQHQNTSPSVVGLALINLSNLSQTTRATFGLVLAVAVLLTTGGVLGYDLWLGHRTRVLAVHLPTDPAGPAGAPTAAGSP